MSMTGASALSAHFFFPFPVFSEAISVLQQPPLSCLGPQLGTVGHRLGQGRGTQGLGGTRDSVPAAPPRGSPRSLLPAGCPRAQHSPSRVPQSTSPPCHPALGTLKGTGQAGIYSERFSRRTVLTAQPQIPPVVVAQRSEIIGARSEWRIMEGFEWESTSQPPLWSKTSSPRYRWPHPPAAPQAPEPHP